MNPQFVFPFWFFSFALLSAQVASADSSAPKNKSMPPMDGRVHVDSYGDPLPNGAVFRIGTTRLRHKSQIMPPFTSVLLSRDGKFVFSRGIFDPEISMWETATGRLVRRFPTHINLPGDAIALSPDGSLLAFGDVYEMHLYDIATGKEQRTIKLPVPTFVFPKRITFSPDGKTLTTLHVTSQPEGNLVSRWEIATFERRESCKTGAEIPIALSADTRFLATLHDREQTIGLWDTADGKKIREWKIEDRVPPQDLCLIFSPDGHNLVTATEDAMIRVYETATGKQVRSWKGRTRGENRGETSLVVVSRLAITPDGKILASVDRDHVLHLWDWKEAKELRRFEGVYGPVAFSADGNILAAGGADGRVRLWETSTGRDLCPFVDPGRVTQVAFSPEGRVLAVDSDRGLSHLLDAENGRALKQVPGYRVLVYSPDGDSLLAVRRDSERLGALCLLDAATGKERCRLQDTNEHERLGGWSPDGKVLVTIHQLGLPIRVWDAATGKKLRDLQYKSVVGWFNTECSSDARMVAIPGRNGAQIRLLATDTGKESRQLAPYSQDVQYSAERDRATMRANLNLRPAFAPNGKMVLAACDRNSFGLWDTASGKRILRWNCTELPPTSPTFSPDGKWLSLPDIHGDPCLVDTATGRVRHRLVWKGGDLGTLFGEINRSFSADGRLFVAAYDPRTLVLWEVATGRPIRTWAGHGLGQLRQMLFSSDGRRLATVGTDGTALVWDVISLSPDGQFPKRKLAAVEVEQAWKDLADTDAAKGYRGLWLLVADPERALPLLRERLHPTPKMEIRRMAQLTADLDSDEFTIRDTATRELRKLGELARPALQRALQDKPSLELRRRAQQLLDELDNAVLSGETLRNLRAVAVLEHIGGAEARRLLSHLAGGASEARLTQEAKGSLSRLRSESDRVKPSRDR